MMVKCNTEYEFKVSKALCVGLYNAHRLLAVERGKWGAVIVYGQWGADTAL
jgi:hypothetical protein